MPLIIFTGYPSSGKTTWANKLREYLQHRIQQAKTENTIGYNYTISYHSDETLGIQHSTYYDSNLEKLARGSQISAIKRDISRNNIVILDTLCYIKGFRYQLHCESKGQATPQAVIHIIAPIEQCIQWNNSKEVNKWDENLIKQLEMRYEEPNSSNRWDSPLFEIISEDNTEVRVFDEIWDSIVLKKSIIPNAATLVKATSGNTFIQELDKKTQDVILKVIQQQQLTTGGDVIIDKENNCIVNLPFESVSISQLQRIRRTYINLNRMRAVETTRIIPMFVDYLNKSLNNE
ncbi:unnamed protein product [Candida verbasci]|uniref:Chromatin associated protein KTI12 n=1 Tax=Candida verbasci TaxID=1227364 RepID=A0A9W4X8A5_9ASCO|nr:unnamed protein product [Candida verbasci]